MKAKAIRRDEQTANRRLWKQKKFRLQVAELDQEVKDAMS